VVDFVKKEGLDICALEEEMQEVTAITVDRSRE
jgi:hypothetical protein